MPTIDVTDAAQRLLANKAVTPGHCLEYVSRAIRNGQQPLIWTGLDTALNCWLLACGDKHDSRDVPKGFPAFLGSKRGNNAGDVIISLGNGRFAATDYPGWGVVGICTLEQREAQTGRKYLGYAGQFLGYTLTTTANASLDITPIDITRKNDTMQLKYDTNGAGYLFTDNGYTVLTGQEWELFKRLKRANEAGDFANPKTDPFLAGEMAIIAGAIRRTATPVDVATIAGAVVNALPDGATESTPDEIAAAVIKATAAQYSK